MTKTQNDKKRPPLPAGTAGKKGETPRKPDKKQRKLYGSPDEMIQPQLNLKAFQIRGEKLRGGFRSLYIQKSISSQKHEQPFLRELVHKCQADIDFCRNHLGVLYMVPRRMSPTDGTRLPPVHAYAGRGLIWYLLITHVDHIGKTDEDFKAWLETVKLRLNEDDIRCNETFFRYAPEFEVTSWGTNLAINGELRTLQHVVTDKEFFELLIQHFRLTRPENRLLLNNSTTFHYEDCFINPATGQTALQNQIETFINAGP